MSKKKKIPARQRNFNPVAFEQKILETVSRNFMSGDFFG